jgi:signal transduction histidine kinase
MRKLKWAIRKISEGSLDFKVEEEYEDEFGGLYRDFENMRVHLQEAINENAAYAQNVQEMISNISHDLKTPLTTIKGYVEGIMDGVADTPEKMDKYLKTIYNKTNDMERLIGELSVYSVIDANDIPYHFRKINVKEYFDDCVEDIRTELESRNFTLAYFNYVPGDVCIKADAEQLHRVINNIINNSIKYNNKKKGIMNIRVREEKEYIHVEFEDNGKGVKPEETGCIFERFYRTDASRNTQTGGSGIGLSIVKKIVEAHGGTVWAVSNQNVGLTIHMMLRREN